MMPSTFLAGDPSADPPFTLEEILEAVRSAAMPEEHSNDQATIAELASVVRSHRPPVHRPIECRIVSRGRRITTRLAAAMVVTVLTAGSSLALTGELPRAAREIASGFLAKVGLPAPAVSIVTQIRETSPDTTDETYEPTSGGEAFAPLGEDFISGSNGTGAPTSSEEPTGSDGQSEGSSGGGPTTGTTPSGDTAADTTQDPDPTGTGNGNGPEGWNGNGGPSEEQGPSTDPPGNGEPPTDLGPPAYPEPQEPPEEQGPPEHAGPPEEAGPPEQAGPPEEPGPPEHAGPPEEPGPPEHAGPPEEPGPPEDLELPSQTDGPQ